jgi:hypothetical protein
MSMFLSFGSTKVTEWQQFVAYEWITAVGILAGTLGFLKSMYSIISILIEKIHEKCCMAKQTGDATPSDTPKEQVLGNGSMRRISKLRHSQRHSEEVPLLTDPPAING